MLPMTVGGGLHVVLVGHTRHPITQPFAGGLESLTWHLARGLLDRGHRVSVFAARGSDQIPGAEHLWPRDLRLSDAARADVSMPDPEWLKRHHAYLDLMLGLAGRTDVDLVHVHALHYLPTAMAPSLPVPTLLTLHTPPTPWLESALQVAASSPRSGLVTSAVSEWTAQAWSHLTDAHVIRNGVDTRAWRPGPGGDGLVWSGRIVPEKAPHLAALIARRAGLPLTLAGPVSDQRYAQEVLWPLCGDGVEYAGHLANSELAELVGTSAAALVTPAWDEPFGLVAAEALACGAPVLGLERGGLPEVVTPRVGRLVAGADGLSEDELVEQAVELLPQVLGLSREDCREHAVARHSVQRMVLDYERLYRHTLTRPTTPVGSGGEVAALEGARPR